MHAAEKTFVPLATDQQENVSFLRLSDSEKTALTTQVLSLPNPYTHPQESMVKALSAFAGQIDSDLLSQIINFGNTPSAPGALLLDNLPVDPYLAPTPEDGEPSPIKKTFVGEACVLGLAKLIGEPVGYKTEKNGRLIHNIIPVRGAETTQSNRSSKVFLSFHNDSVYDESLDFHRSNPDFILLYCHRPDFNHEALTYFIDARDVVAGLDKETVRILYEPLFCMAAPSNYTMLMNSGQKVWSEPLPILKGPLAYPEITMGANGVKPISDIAEQAYEQLLNFLRDMNHRFQVALSPGQALLINNRKGLHARTSFMPTFGPQERWLLRANIRRDTWSMRNHWTGENLVFN